MHFNGSIARFLRDMREVPDMCLHILKWKRNVARFFFSFVYEFGSKTFIVRVSRTFTIAWVTYINLLCTYCLLAFLYEFEYSQTTTRNVFEFSIVCVCIFLVILGYSTKSRFILLLLCIIILLCVCVCLSVCFCSVLTV